MNADGRRQNWLAERLGVDPRQVWGWMHGIHIPADATQAKIADALGRTVESLWPSHDDAASPDEPDARTAAGDELDEGLAA